MGALWVNCESSKWANNKWETHILGVEERRQELFGQGRHVVELGPEV